MTGLNANEVESKSSEPLIAVTYFSLCCIYLILAILSTIRTCKLPPLKQSSDVEKQQTASETHILKWFYTFVIIACSSRMIGFGLSASLVTSSGFKA